MEMNKQVKSVLSWYWNTSALVGIPVLFILLVMMMDKTLSTVTCQIAGQNCDRAIGALPSNVKIDLPGYTYSGQTEEDPSPPKKGK